MFRRLRNRSRRPRSRWQKFVRWRSAHEDSARALRLTWIYAAAFGLPAIPISAYLVAQDTCPRLWACSRRTWSVVARRTPNLRRPAGGFPRVTILAAWSAWWLWRGRRSGAVVNLALLPIEAIFWLGFAVPIPWLFGIARAVLLAAS